MTKIKYWTTKKINEVLNNPYGCSDIGTDFEELLPELQEELWQRLQKTDAKQFLLEEKRYSYE